MIKSIIFDWGGVISKKGSYTEFSEIHSKEFNKTPEEIHFIIKKYWNIARINKIKSYDFWKFVSRDLNCGEEYFRNLLKDYVSINYDVLKFIKKIKKNYKLALLSNQIEDWLEEIIRKHNFNDIFDVIVTSYNIGVEKPKKEIYMKTLSELGFEPFECVFIDDKEKNVLSAKEIGIKTILFKNFIQMKKELESFGVKVG